MSDDENLSDQVVEAYKDGEKISAIEKRFNIPVATIYMLLDRAGEAPDRMRRADRLAGNRIQMGHLYDIIREQHEWIMLALPIVASVSPDLAASVPQWGDMLAGGG